jgi:hypothetical protein
MGTLHDTASHCQSNLPPLREARARSVLEYLTVICLTSDDRPDMALLFGRFTYDPTWTRHDVELAVNDLVERGCVAIYSDAPVIELDVLCDVPGVE